MKNILTSIFFTVLLSGSFAQTNVTLHIDQKLGDIPFAYQQAVESSMGYTFNVTRLQYYVSEIKLIHDGGQVTPVTDMYLLVDPEKRDEFELGSFPVTDLEQIEFSIGVDSAHNHLDPATYPPTHPLAHQNPSMHWGWFSGYRFIALEGFAGDDPDSLIYGYQIHTIADANYRTVVVDAVEEMVGDEMFVHVQADYMGMFEGIDVSDGLIFHGASGAAKKLTDNTRDFVFSPGQLTSTNRRLDNKITFSPNPARDLTSLYIDVAVNRELLLLISDVNGKLVLSRKIDASGSEHLIDISWPAGTYFAGLYDGVKQIAIQTLIVK